MSLKTNDYVIAEYIWIGGKGELRSKARTLYISKSLVKTDHIHQNTTDYNLEDIPQWNYDGSSTGQAEERDSDVMLHPCAIYRCPFRKGDNMLVMCDTYRPDGKPLDNNHRYWSKSVFDKKKDEEPQFGLEQEYFLMKRKQPLGMNYFTLETPPQGQYYCSVGTDNAFGREIVEEHYVACLTAGLKISGVNAEVAIGQWEFQIGPVEGVYAGDQLYIGRYILLRIAEKYCIEIDIEPKPVNGDWNGSGCHTNYSTKSMREKTTNEKTGLDYINEAIDRLSKKHDEHMKHYGTGNELRMTGKHETSRYDVFSSGVANRGASIRIPNDAIKNNCGYFEDRRPSSNMNPYLVCGMLFNTTIVEHLWYY